MSVSLTSTHYYYFHMLVQYKGYTIFSTSVIQMMNDTLVPALLAFKSSLLLVKYL